MDDLRDQFPIGMSVLAVDDDRICLKILETLLQKCQYHVTTAKNAITALNLLRKNKKSFDLVISDVHMPDMDGFKLLELIGLEMDLPVIMLSGNDDPKMVMKGILHGACDYLLKPVRIEELQNIWQHVIRKKKKKITKTSNQDGPNSDSCNELNSAVTTNENQNEKSSRKRKEHNDDGDVDDEDNEERENDHDNEDPTVHKKPRVVWSVELHRRFLAAVNQLGLDKAVPKKILELMNVENLTRENVASHLQKYRLYLRRNSGVANQQANADQSYLRMSSGTFQLLQQQNLNNSINDQFKFQSTVIRANMPMSVGLDQLQNNRGVVISPMQNFTNKLSDYRSKVGIGCTASPVLNFPNNALMLEPKVVPPYNNFASHHSQFSPSNFLLPRETAMPLNPLININSQGVRNPNVSYQGWINHNQGGINHSHHVNGSSIVSSSISANAGGEPLGMNQLKSQNSGISSNFGSVEEDMLSTVIPKQKPDTVKLLDGYMYDKYSGGTSK